MNARHDLPEAGAQKRYERLLATVGSALERIETAARETAELMARMHDLGGDLAGDLSENANNINLALHLLRWELTEAILAHPRSDSAGAVTQ